jgi:hypothetical protein
MEAERKAERKFHLEKSDDQDPNGAECEDKEEKKTAKHASSPRSFLRRTVTSVSMQVAQGSNGAGLRRTASAPGSGDTREEGVSSENACDEESLPIMQRSLFPRPRPTITTQALDNSELVTLIDDQGALQSKIQEALATLEAHHQSQTAGHPVVQEGRVVRFQNNNVELNNLQQTRSPQVFSRSLEPTHSIRTDVFQAPTGPQPVSCTPRVPQYPEQGDARLVCLRVRACTVCRY